MLDEKDKEWILGAISGTVTGIVDQKLEKGFEAQKSWFANELKTQLKTELEIGLNKLRLELTDVMVAGFSECASALQVERVQKRLEWLEENTATKAYVDRRLIEHGLVHKQEANKFRALVEALRNEKTLSTRRANSILAFEPLPIKLNE